MTVFEADWICPVVVPPIRHGVIVVEDGRIVSVGPRLEATLSLEESVTRVRLAGCAIVPGFVNAHTHLELTILRGLLENLPFFSWIRTVTRAKVQHLTRDELLVSARLGVIESLAAGVTTVGEVMDVGTSWDAMLEMGLQGIAYQEIFGPSDSMIAESMTRLTGRIERRRATETAMQRIGVSPHAPYTVSRRLFEIVRDYAAGEGLRLTIHVAESEDECRFLRNGQGPFADSHRERGFAVDALNCSPIQYLDGLGLLKPETLLIHAIELDDRDLETINEKRPAVVHCPKSNAKLGNGTARITEMVNSGVRLGLGTDSVASNNVVDMFEEMRAAVFQQRTRARRIDALDAATAFRMATLGGAECLGLENEIGSLEPGKRADFAVADLNDPGLQPVYDPIETMVYSASRRNVRAVYLGGREVRVDASDLLRETAAIADRLRRELLG